MPIRGRFKSRKKTGLSSSNSLEVYLSHQVITQTSNEQSSRSRTSSAEPPEKNVGLFVDLNDKGRLQLFSCLFLPQFILIRMNAETYSKNYYLMIHKSVWTKFFKGFKKVYPLGQFKNTIFKALYAIIHPSLVSVSIFVCFCIYGCIIWMMSITWHPFCKNVIILVKKPLK